MDERFRAKIEGVVIFLVRLIFVIIACFVFAVLISCRSSRRVEGDVVESVAANQRATGRVERAVESLDDTISSSRERIRAISETGGAIADGIERLEYLFDEYEREVERILSEIERIREEIAIQGETDSGLWSVGDSGDDSAGSLGVAETEVQD